MIITPSKELQQLLDASGHTLVVGGPGSGKTTFAILKAARRIKDGLSDGQSVLFLSFSRAAVARLVQAVSDNIPDQSDRLNIQTFHSFFWSILRTHGYLLGTPRPLSILTPQDESVMSNGMKHDDPNWEQWIQERGRLFYECGRVAFDLFAPKVEELLKRSKQIVKIVSQRFPLVIVDEAQDTNQSQWSCVKSLSTHLQVICLADLDQQIYDWLPGIGPERMKDIESGLAPVRIDLGPKNNRSPDNDILAFGNDILMGTVTKQSYNGIAQKNFSPQRDLRNKAIRQSIGIVRQAVKKQTGAFPQSIAVLSSFEKGVRIISEALRSGDYIIPHDILFDETAALLSSRFIAFLLEPKYPSHFNHDLGEALELIGAIFRANGSRTALSTAERLRYWANQVQADRSPTKAAMFAKLNLILKQRQSHTFSGDPAKDWVYLRGLLRDSGLKELQDIDNNAENLMLFNRGKRIASRLSSLWDQHGAYTSARNALDSALAQDQLLNGDETAAGVHVMTMHKSKGKQFDAVIIYREGRSSPFVWRNDNPPFRKSRKVLRVAITRARHQVLILNDASTSCPIISPFKL